MKRGVLGRCGLPSIRLPLGWLWLAQKTLLGGVRYLNVSSSNQLTPYHISQHVPVLLAIIFHLDSSPLMSVSRLCLQRAHRRRYLSQGVCAFESQEKEIVRSKSILFCCVV